MSAPSRQELQWTAGPGTPAGLLEFLVERLGGSRRAAKRWLDERVVFVNGRRVWMAKHPLRPGDRVEIAAGAAGASGPGAASRRPAGPARPAPRPAAAIPVLAEEADFLVVDKPAGLLSNEDPDSVEGRLRRERREPGLTAVHRLDRDTSGCFLLARSAAGAVALGALFRRHQVHKVYRAIVVGRWPGEVTRVDQPVEGRPACSHFRLRSWSRDASELEVEIETGRTHQIRRHAWSVGCPVAGDRQYGGSMALPELFRGVPRQLLHAWKVAFEPPAGGRPVRVTCPLPADYRDWLRRLELQA